MVWPGAVTVVLPSKEKRDGFKTIGLRLPNYPILVRIIEEFGRPLTATSANPSGERPAGSLKEIIKSLAQEPDLFVEAGRLEGKPSTVVEINSGLKVLREGAVSFSEIQRFWQKAQSKT